MKETAIAKAAGLAEPCKSESLDQEADRVIEEARMVLPGIQALFGFQLIAVFSPRFETGLLSSQQYLHLSAIVCVVVAIALIMAPAAYHRQAERGLISRYFTDLASRLLTLALVPLLLGIVLELFLVSQVIAKSVAVGVSLAAGVFVAYLGLWFIFPRIKAKQRAALLRSREE
jgi:uncharacterized BrkB/YihY/UPF0761 family membrane protein